jgi:enoyl-CoA hydratase
MSLVVVDRQPPLRHVTLDTGRRNVLTPEAVRALRAALAPDDEAPVVVLRGRRDAFCAGLDNATLAAGEVERESLLAEMGELLLEALRGPTRIVAVCEGHAVAAGAMLLLVSDVRIGVGGDHRIGFTEPGLGMPLPELPALLARERLDRRRLHELTVLGRTVGPEEAARAGFLDELASVDALEGRATEWAESLAALTDVAYQGSLEAVWGSTLARLDALVRAQTERRDRARAERG